jgi:hypothetical protein
MPMTVDPKNLTKAFGGLQLFFQICAVMDVMHMGYVTFVDCANRAYHQFTYYAYKCDLPVTEFHKMMQHQQLGVVKSSVTLMHCCGPSAKTVVIYTRMKCCVITTLAVLVQLGVNIFKTRAMVW